MKIQWRRKGFTWTLQPDVMLIIQGGCIIRQLDGTGNEIRSIGLRVFLSSRIKPRSVSFRTRYHMSGQPTVLRYSILGRQGCIHVTSVMQKGDKQIVNGDSVERKYVAVAWA
jgi:hypothetical protein